MKTNKGFTLIELLVVIAIIGILSSVVLASLTTARSKGSDAAVQAQLSNMRAQAELYYSAGSGYGNAVALTTTGCASADTATLIASTANGSLKTLLKGVIDITTVAKTVCAIGTAAEVTAVSTAASTWAIAAVLPSDPANAWCVDSTGASKKVAVTTSGSPAGAVIAGGTCRP